MKVSVSKVLGLASLAALSLQAVSPAQAADMYNPNGGYNSYKDSPRDFSPNYFSWSGYYFGVTGGYAFGDANSKNKTGNGFDDGAGNASSVGVELEGASVSVNGGYNYQFNKYVFGLEADVGYMALDDRKTDAVLDNFAEVTYGLYGTLSGRLGYAMDRTLLFAKGGVAFAQIDTTAGDGTNAADRTRHDETWTGYVVGAGIEHAIDLQWIAKIEYQYMDFGNESSTNSQGDVFKHDNSVQNIRVGLSYKF